jgi:hypothetical protein
MNFRSAIRGTAFAAVLMFVAMGTAQAQATRTWVSGVGDDVNPCSRTAPCKTFAGAISKTAAGGEIDVLDPGGFGGVTITKALTIDGRTALAGVLVAGGTNGIVISAGATDVVHLRNLEINGNGSALAGIRFNSGKELHVDNVRIQQFQAASPSGNGIAFLPTAASLLFVTNSNIDNNGVNSAGAISSGILIQPVLPGGSVKAVIENVTLSGNQFGLRVETGSQVIMKNSRAIGNINSGIQAISAAAPGAILALDNVNTSNNGSNGIKSDGANALVRLSNTAVFNNNTGLNSVNSGQIISYLNNRVVDNVGNGAPTGTLGQQ